MNKNNPQLHFFQVSEIEVTYHPKIPAKDRQQIRTSQDCYEVFQAYWDVGKMAYEEHFCVMLLNRANKVIGIHKHSKGGLSGTIADNKQVFGIILKCNAAAFILAHNHPSNNLKPSKADIDLTKKFKKGAEFLGLNLLDHIILTENGYYSFADEGTL